MFCPGRILCRALAAAVVLASLAGCGESYRAVDPRRPLPASLPSADVGRQHLVYATFDRASPELRYAISRNGQTWRPVAGGKGFFRENADFRDPSIVQGPDGVYHCVYTSGDPGSIGHISSTDLINWSPPRWLPVMKHEPGVRVSWAPDLLWDAKRSEWLLVWSSDVADKFRVDKDDERFIHRLYAATTRDFVTLSPTWLFFDPGHNVIDPEIVQFRGEYLLFYKDERLTPDRKVILMSRASDPRGPFKPGVETLPLAPIEGASALVEQDRLVLYFDAYVDDAMGAMETFDLVTWTDISDRVWFPRGHRHGSVIRVDAQTYAKLADLQPDAAVVSDAPPAVAQRSP